MITLEKKIVCAAGIKRREASSLKSNNISYILENLDFSKSFSQLSEVYTEFTDIIAKVKNPLIKAEFEQLAKIAAESEDNKLTLENLCDGFYLDKVPIASVWRCFRRLKMLLFIWYPFWKMNDKKWVFNAETKKKLFAAIDKMIADEDYKSLRVDIRNETLSEDTRSIPPSWLELKVCMLNAFRDTTYNEN